MRKPSSTNYRNALALNDCSLTYAMSLIGGRWKPIILFKVTNQIQRFSQLKRAIPFISEKMLATQLREMEHDRLLIRTVLTEKPLRVEYTLTELSEALQPLLWSLCEWGNQVRSVKDVLVATED